MDKALSTAMLTIGGLIASAVLLGTLLPAVSRSANTMERLGEDLRDGLQSDVRITNIYSELDATETWQDIDSDTYFDLWVWARNTGTKTVRDIDKFGIFVGTQGSSERIPYTADAGVSYPQWSYTIEGGALWEPETTLRITVHYEAAVTPGTHIVQVVTPAGTTAFRSVGL